MIALLCAGAGLAWAADEALELSGFVKPTFSAVSTPAALPEDRIRIGLSSSRAGLTFRGQPLDQWRYKVFFVVGSDTFPALVGAKAVDTDNDGAVDRVDTETRGALGDIVRETSVSWVPSESIGIRAGRMPVPFTSAAQSADVALLFPDRAGPNDLFLADDDLGALLEANVPDGTLAIKAGLFNGTGTGPGGGQRGVLYLARVDLQPLGEFSFDETNPLRSEPKVGIGAGLIWHPYQAFDGVGFSRLQINDLRGSASLRVGLAGLSLSLEGLHRYQLDNLTARPIIASGAYVQGGWRLPSAIEPIGRIGWAAEDRSFAPRTTLWLEGGFNLYPAFGNEDESLRDDVRMTFVYQGENRITEGEFAHGAVASVVLSF